MKLNKIPSALVLIFFLSLIGIEERHMVILHAPACTYVPCFICQPVFVRRFDLLRFYIFNTVYSFIVDTSDIQKYNRRSADKGSSNRFLTQPVTVDEVQEAAKLKEVDDRSGTNEHILPCHCVILFDFYCLQLLQMKKAIRRT